MTTAGVSDGSWSIQSTTAYVTTEESVTALSLGEGDCSSPVVLDGSGAAIWSVIEAKQQRGESCSTADIVREMVALYSLDEEKITPDVITFLNDLQARGLLERIA
ncbi:PqqD family protein [Rathayibacter toxicus]|uniref:PqqD family protein n=1 Tax=Rathayibacter toxicus TaxID=145458 RepID=A0A0C5BFM1_9MICO|nr:PqqD family protein [Rathayibacter toxicus]AJM77904.1 hypothetical protein TI83_07975 [Rathayibacter toxicus]KKM46904.1 hypothetical protein VT73_01105 [Rathayibacter toxicus]PPG20420.1 PqqD family protein [Rathayibacter toxicus]PPG45522.1 PqqD family protein [Rathayibacter toxicus]PPH56824.1 PqqD family protein [Rathayibacter toxicus]